MTNFTLCLTDGLTEALLMLEKKKSLLQQDTGDTVFSGFFAVTLQ